ncbi:uncharacterized protein LOC108102225 [Drosophila ficusphila]|uniref:uncharacterized protein LOC108102225 n=1 Tax=Drosophila ficusphila TaxID=30025 RepID=UPI001C8A22BF|nr:uncharacterized protein LOC108102225 [Drosophila ficusphila]
MFAVYSCYDVGANEEVDNTELGPSSKITAEQRAEKEMQSIILLAHQEHEAQTYHQVMTAIKQREAKELNKLRDVNPMPSSFVRSQTDHDEEVRVLLDQVAFKEDNGDEDDE